MKIEMEFQGLKELMKAFEDAASDEDIKEVNQKIVKQSEPVVKNIMSGKIPKSADIKLSGRGFGSKSSVTSHAADSIPMGAVKMKDTGATADVGWEKSDNSEHFYVKFINWELSIARLKNLSMQQGVRQMRNCKKSQNRNINHI